jgi:hypothetical protein
VSESENFNQKRQRAIDVGRKIDWIIAISIVLIAITFIFMLFPLPQRATFFPWFITISMVLFGSVYVFHKLRKPNIWDELYSPNPESNSAEIDTGPAYLLPYWGGIFKAFAMFLGVVIAAIAIGPKWAVPLFVTAALWISGERKLLAVGSGLMFWLIVHFVFNKAMSINLPEGLLQEIFG